MYLFGAALKEVVEKRSPPREKLQKRCEVQESKRCFLYNYNKMDIILDCKNSFNISISTYITTVENIMIVLMNIMIELLKVFC